MAQTRYLDGVYELINQREEIFNADNDVKNSNTLTCDGEYPLVDNKWLKIPDVACVFVDIRNSTGLSATAHEKDTASIYELFTGTAIKMFHLFKSDYIDIKGDGVFALFNGNQVHRALASAVSFKTFAENSFLRLVKEKLAGKVDIGFHMGIDQKTVLVKQLGLKDAEGRDRRKNEVWAGKPINMAAKLASLSKDGELLVSDRFYQNLSDSESVQKSCGCTLATKLGMVTRERDDKISLWEKKEKVVDGVFDFDDIYSLSRQWCEVHGKEWCEKIIALDEQ